MTVSKTVRRAALAVACAALLFPLAGCSPAAGTPEQAVTLFFEALGSADYAGAWGLLSASDQDRLTEELASLRGADTRTVDRLNRQLGSSFAASGVSGMSGPDFFETAMKFAMAKDQSLQNLVKAAPEIKTSSVATDAMSADVDVRLGGRKSGTNRVVRCVRDGAGWRIQFRP